MRRINLSFILIFIIIIAIVGIGIAVPAIYFSEAYSGVNVEQEWTPVNTTTPTQTVTASSTPTIQSRLVSTISPTPMPTEDTNCVFPSEYWEEHTELWLDLLVGNTIYSKDDIHLIFDHPSPEIHPTLLKQLYLANLNIFTGADPIIIQEVLVDANQWLQENLPDEQLSEETLSIGVQLAQTLVAFNTGLIGPGYCSPYEDLIVTPMVILSPTSTSSPTAIITATATRYFVTLEPTAVPTKTEKPDKKPEPTDPPRPTKEPDTPAPPPTNPPPPTDAPPEPTNPPKPTPTPAS